MKMEKIIDRVSEIYREERIKLKKIRQDRQDVLCKLMNIDYTKGKNVSLAEYNYLIERRKCLDREVESETRYCDGISCVRELLMNIGFDTEVE